MLRLLISGLVALIATLGTAQTPAELPFEKEILAYEAADAKAMPAKGGVVFVGSSSIRLWKTLPTDFPGLNVINRGFGGSSIPDSIRYAKRIIVPYAPKMIVFFAGTNDIAGGRSAETVAASFREFVGTVRKDLPSARIAFIAISPAPSRWDKVQTMRRANALIREYCAEGDNLAFIDTFPLMLTPDGLPRPELYVADQLHLNAEGYRLWRKVVAPFLPW